MAACTIAVLSPEAVKCVGNFIPTVSLTFYNLPDFVLGKSVDDLSSFFKIYLTLCHMLRHIMSIDHMTSHVTSYQGLYSHRPQFLTTERARNLLVME